MLRGAACKISCRQYIHTSRYTRKRTSRYTILHTTKIYAQVIHIIY